MDMLLLLMKIDKEECQTVNTQKMTSITKLVTPRTLTITSSQQSAEDRTLSKHQ